MPWHEHVGKVFHRRADIRIAFGGNQVMGISHSNDAENAVIVVSDPERNAYGYRDKFLVDGSYEYYGQRAKEGDAWDNNNHQIRDHMQNGRSILLFIEQDGEYRFEGEWFYNGHHEIEVGGKRDRQPQVIFNLVRGQVLTQDVLESKVEEFSGISDEALRQQAIDAGNNRPGARGERNVYYRAAAVTAHVLRRAKGVCECCKTPAPFKTKRDKPYLECHHVDRRADSGPDDIYSVIALHPLCHSRIHHAADGDEQNEKARRILAEKEPRPTQYDS